MTFALRTETATLLRRSPVLGVSGTPVLDRYGAPSYQWSETPLVGVAVWPTRTDEDLAGRERVTTTWEALLPAGTPVAPSDRLRVRGGLWEVDGQPFAWMSPFGALLAGVQVRIRRVTG